MKSADPAASASFCLSQPPQPLPWLIAFGLGAFFLPMAAQCILDGAYLTALSLTAAVGAVIGWMRHRPADLADAVYDLGDCLRIRRGKLDETIPLAQISSIRLRRSQLIYIELTLAGDGPLGRTVQFVPVARFSWNIFKPRSVYSELTMRIAQAAKPG